MKLTHVILLLLGVAAVGYFLYSRNRASALVSAPVDSLDADIAAANESAAASDAQLQDAYNQGKRDGGKEEGKRVRAAFLTGGGSELGRLLGLKF